MRRAENVDKSRAVDEAVRNLRANAWTARQAANHLRRAGLPFNVAWRVVLIPDMRRAA